MKILVNTPFITILAGVSNHYLGLKPYFSDNVIYNQFYTQDYLHRILNKKYITIMAMPFAFVFNYLKFIFLLVHHKRPTVLLNPSFGKRAIHRDALYLRIAVFFGCKVAVFIHGWDKSYLEKVHNREVQFSNAWFKADAFFVLAKEFKEYLVKLNIQAPIYLTTTKVNDQLIRGVFPKKIKKVNTILFLARVEKAKGVFTAIDAFNILSQNYPEMQLRVVGHGNALTEAKEYVKNKDSTRIIFLGPLTGHSLKSEFMNADIYILPSHSEGMPTSVLEAMAFGLPIISRPVGGLVDFFKNDKMGYLIEGFEPEDYALKIESLINDIDKVNQISIYNAKYAKDHFMASKVANQVEKILSLI